MAEEKEQQEQEVQGFFFRGSRRKKPLFPVIKKKKRKKPGPKKKRRKKVIKEPYVFPKKPYRLIITKNKEKVQHVKSFAKEEDAYKLFHEALEQNKEVVFPVRFVNYRKIQSVEYELYIIKERTEDDKNITSTKLRNEMGEFIEYTTDHQDFIVIDKAKWELEESFWVFGFHPQQRKTFSWIFEDFIESTIKDKMMFKNVLIYKNKFIVDCGENNLKIVFCKNRDDAVRMYNEVERLCTEKKYKYVMFSGDIQQKSSTILRQWITKLCDFTGYNRRKITRYCLRP